MSYPAGIQAQGASSLPIYLAALERVRELGLPKGARVADVGGGRGNFSGLLVEEGFLVALIDYEPNFLDDRFEVRASDLNERWSENHDEFDAVISFEVIEHLENPRHFMRGRTAKPKSNVILSAPSQPSISSKACFLFRDQYKNFQESCYPANIAPVLDCDF